MKTTLISLLTRLSPSKIILNNCIELIQREQTGLPKYGVSLTDAPLTHEQTLQHLLEEQLDAANYTRKALMTASAAHMDYAILRKDLERLITDLGKPARYTGASALDVEDAYSHGVEDTRERIKTMLHRFDSSKVLRDMRS